MRYDVAIVGGGLLGLATARELLLRRPSLGLCVLEKEPGLARHQSGRNSGVIHSGVYYAPGSLKARLCLSGSRALYAYCDSNGIPYRRTGKLIVATGEAELPALQRLFERGKENGIEGLEMLDEAAIAAREPYCRGVRALFVPSTGIVDYREVAAAYARDVAAMGGAILTGFRVEGFARNAHAITVRGDNADIRARYVITCAGVFADRIARMTGGKPDPQIVPFRGDYLILRPEKQYLVKGNIYPVPDPAFPFLGVHFTPRINGDVWLGPNAVLAFSREGYRPSTIRPRDLVESLTYRGFRKLAQRHFVTGAGELYRDLNRGAFVKALQRYVPALRVADTMPGPAGIRAQALDANGTLVDDFVFEESEGILHVRNAPSPAATSSLAIAGHIADVVEGGASFKNF